MIQHLDGSTAILTLTIKVWKRKCRNLDRAVDDDYTVYTLSFADDHDIVAQVWMT